MRPEMIQNRELGVIERICILSITVIVSVFALI